MGQEEASADLKSTYGEIIVGAKETIADGRIAVVGIHGCGAYTVGMDGHDLPDIIIIDNIDDESDERTAFICNVAVNFYHHISMMTADNDDQRVVEHIDYYVNDEECARFLIRKVPMEKPWEHLVVMRDIAPNDNVVQIHLPDSNNRVWGEEGYQPHATRGEMLFEVVPTHFN